MKLKFGCLIGRYGKGRTKCLKDRIGASKIMAHCTLLRESFGSEEFSHQIGSADVKVGDRNFIGLHSKSLLFNPIALQHLITHFPRCPLDTQPRRSQPLKRIHGVSRSLGFITQNVITWAMRPSLLHL